MNWVLKDSLNYVHLEPALKVSPVTQNHGLIQFDLFQTTTKVNFFFIYVYLKTNNHVSLKLKLSDTIKVEKIRINLFWDL